MATRRAHRGGSVLFRWTQQLWLLVLAGLLTTHVMTAAASVQTPTTVKAVGDTVSTPDADTAYPLMGAGSPTQGKISSDENENLFRLRNAIAAADATETEKLTDSRFFLGAVSQRFKRHLLVDILAVLALLAGYCVFAAGMERRAAAKSAGRNASS